MGVSRASVALIAGLATMGCGVETAPPPVGDVGDTSGSALKVACNLSRDDILSNAQGDRRNAIERGFSWYDAQVSYSQSSNYEGYRTDCSGFVSMCWELGQSYTTANFVEDGSEWTSLGSFDELLPADAMVYRSGGSGHIMMFVGWNDSSSKSEACVLEQASTAEDMQFRARTTDSLQSSGYHAIRATKFGGGDTEQTGAGGSSGQGGSGGDSQCYCDSECAQYGDCCSNCSSGSGGSSGSSGSGGTSGGGGSGGGGQCYCDSECAQFGDCCSNCSGSGGSGSGGTSGSGGSGGQCYCDANCAQYGDCCAGCGSGGSSGGGSGGSGGQCYCDADCYQYGDCCAGC